MCTGHAYFAEGLLVADCPALDATHPVYRPVHVSAALYTCIIYVFPMIARLSWLNSFVTAPLEASRSLPLDRSRSTRGSFIT